MANKALVSIIEDMYRTEPTMEVESIPNSLVPEDGMVYGTNKNELDIILEEIEYETSVMEQYSEAHDTLSGLYDIVTESRGASLSEREAKMVQNTLRHFVGNVDDRKLFMTTESFNDLRTRSQATRLVTEGLGDVVSKVAKGIVDTIKKIYKFIKELVEKFIKWLKGSSGSGGGGSNSSTVAKVDTLKNKLKEVEGYTKVHKNLKFVTTDKVGSGFSDLAMIMIAATEVDTKVNFIYPLNGIELFGVLDKYASKSGVELISLGEPKAYEEFLERKRNDDKYYYLSLAFDNLYKTIPSVTAEEGLKHLSLDQKIPENILDGIKETIGDSVDYKMFILGIPGLTAVRTLVLDRDSSTRLGVYSKTSYETRFTNNAAVEKLTKEIEEHTDPVLKCQHLLKAFIEPALVEIKANETNLAILEKMNKETDLYDKIGGNNWLEKISKAKDAFISNLTSEADKEAIRLVNPVKEIESMAKLSYFLCMFFRINLEYQQHKRRSVEEVVTVLNKELSTIIAKNVATALT